MKRTWVKLLCVVIAVVMMGSMFVGCGGTEQGSDSGEDTSKNDQEQQSSDNNTSEEKVKLTWWTEQRHDMDYMKQVIADFTEKNPNYEIEYNIQTDNYAQNLELAFQSGQAPDMYGMKYGANYYVDRKMIAPIDEYITDELKERFKGLLQVELTNYVDGKLYSLPNMGNIFRYVYNKELYEKAGLTEPPKTLSEMVEYAAKITEAGKADGQYGFAINLKTTKGAFERSFDKIAEASGLLPYNRKEGKYDFSVLKPIVLAYKEMYDKGYMFPGVEGLSMDPLRSQFAEGKIGSYISAHWEVGVYNNQFPAKIEWAAAPVPVVDGQEGKGQISVPKAGSWLAISSQSKNKDAAWKVFEFAYSPDVLTGYHENGLATSIVPSIAEQAKVPQITGSEFFQFNEEIDGFYPPVPFSFGYQPSYSLKPEGKEYYDVLTSVILGATDVNQAIEDLNKRYNAALEEAIEKGKITKEKIVDPNFDPSQL